VKAVNERKANKIFTKIPFNYFEKYADSLNTGKMPEYITISTRERRAENAC
jgi:hypothetical protein